MTTTKSTSRRKALIGCGIAAAILATVGITAAAQADKPLEAHSAIVAPVTAPATTTKPVATSRDFSMALIKHLPLLDSAADHMKTAGTAAQWLDVDGAADAAEAAGKEYRELLDIVDTLPGKYSEVGVLTTTAFETCAEANEDGAVALRDLDQAGIEHSTRELGDCADDMAAATDAIGG